MENKNRNVSSSNGPLPTVLEIMQFLKRKANFQVESDREFINIDPGFILGAIFEACIALKLAQRTEIYKRALIRLTDGESNTQDWNFLLKFLVVRDVFNQYLKFQDLSLHDFISPEKNKIRMIFGHLMRYSMRYDIMLSRFSSKIHTYQSLIEERKVKSEIMQQTQNRLQKLDEEKAMERPAFESLSEACKLLTSQVKELKQALQSKTEELENIKFSFDETVIIHNSKKRDLETYRDRCKDLTAQIVSDDAEILASRDRAKELLLSLQNEVKEWENRITIAEANRVKIERLIGILENDESQLEVLTKKKQSLEVARSQLTEIEMKVAKSKQTLEELGASLEHLSQMEESENSNFQSYKRQLSEMQEKCENDLKEQANQLRETDSLLASIDDEYRTLEGTLNHCQGTLSKLNEQMESICKMLEEMHMHAREKFENYKQAILRTATNHPIEFLGDKE